MQTKFTKITNFLYNIKTKKNKYKTKKKVGTKWSVQYYADNTKQQIDKTNFYLTIIGQASS